MGSTPADGNQSGKGRPHCLVGEEGKQGVSSPQSSACCVWASQVDDPQHGRLWCEDEGPHTAMQAGPDGPPKWAAPGCGEAVLGGD